MIGDRSVLGIITARGGSKGFPGKNLASLAGKPLLVHTVETALRSNYIDRLIISSDDKNIIEMARIAGCEVPFVRPAKLALDDTTHIPVINHALDTLETEYDYFALLQPTSPLRKRADIDGCISRCHDLHAPAAVTVTKFDKNPIVVVKLDNQYRMQPLLRSPVPESGRQQNNAFILNGAVYVCRCDWWRENQQFICDQSVAYVMPAERSIDVDTEADLILAEELYKQENANG